MEVAIFHGYLIFLPPKTSNLLKMLNLQDESNKAKQSTIGDYISQVIMQFCQSMRVRMDKYSSAYFRSRVKHRYLSLFLD